MTKLNDETRELTTDELNAVTGGDSWLPGICPAADAYHVINEMLQDTAKVLAAAGLPKRC